MTSVARRAVLTVVGVVSFVAIALGQSVSAPQAWEHAGSATTGDANWTKASIQNGVAGIGFELEGELTASTNGKYKTDGRTMSDGVWLEECYISEDHPMFKITAKYKVTAEASYPLHSKGSGLTTLNASSYIKFSTGYWDHWQVEFGAEDTHPDTAQVVHSSDVSGEVPAASDTRQVANDNYVRQIQAARVDIYISISGTVSLSANRADVMIKGKASSVKSEDGSVPSLSGKVTAYAGDPPVVKLIAGTSNPDERSFG